MADVHGQERKESNVKIAIVMEVKGDAGDAFDVIDSVLDDGTIQDAIAERATDKDVDMRIVSVVSERAR